VHRGWHRVRGTPPNEQTWASEPYDVAVVPVDTNVAGDAQLKHAQEQIAIAGQYPGRSRGLPSAKVIELDPTKR
jgi:hypothetical protein